MLFPLVAVFARLFLGLVAVSNTAGNAGNTDMNIEEATVVMPYVVYKAGDNLPNPWIYEPKELDAYKIGRCGFAATHREAFDKAIEFAANSGRPAK